MASAMNIIEASLKSLNNEELTKVIQMAAGLLSGTSVSAPTTTKKTTKAAKKEVDPDAPKKPLSAWCAWAKYSRTEYPDFYESHKDDVTDDKKGGTKKVNWLTLAALLRDENLEDYKEWTADYKLHMTPSSTPSASLTGAEVETEVEEIPAPAPSPTKEKAPKEKKAKKATK